MTATSQTPSSTPQINPKYACFRLRVAPSPIHRWGMYAGEKIPKGRKIIEYTGEKCNRRETKIRAEREFNYLFTLDSYWTIDGSVNGSGAELSIIAVSLTSSRESSKGTSCTLQCATSSPVKS